MQASKAVVSLCICINSPEHSLLETAVSTKISCADPIKLYTIQFIQYQTINVSELRLECHS